MKKIFYLSTCSTCLRIIAKLKLADRGFTFQDIKTQPITELQLKELKDKTGSYESLFSKRALKYKALVQANKTLKEDDYKHLILKEYTFLKRPVILAGNTIFVGNSKKVIQAAEELITCQN